MSDFKQIVKIISKICSSNLKSETEASLEFLQINFVELRTNLIRFLRLADLIDYRFDNYSTVFEIKNKKAEDWTSALKDGLIYLCKEKMG